MLSWTSISPNGALQNLADHFLLSTYPLYELLLGLAGDNCGVLCILALDRAHIVPAVFKHGISEYGNKEGGEYWEEMWLPDDELPPTALPKL